MATEQLGPLPLKLLKQTHPEYDASYMRRCRALYAGGRLLLGTKSGESPAVLKDVFPKHLHEEGYVYKERCRRAYYLPYAGAIIDMIVAELFAERLAMTSEPEADEFYEEFFEDVSPPGGRVMSFNDYLKHQTLTALVCKRAWGLVDLPRLAEDQAAPGSLADQEKLGVLSAYAMPLDPEAVRDWEMDDDGVLKWVLLAFEHSPRESLLTRRNLVTLEYLHYTTDQWARYAITYDREKQPMGPPDETPVPVVGSGPLSAGRVPISILELSEGLWAMGKLESLAAAHLNKINALAWAQYKTLFPVLAAFAGPTELGNTITEDPNRAQNQIYGSGRVVSFGHQDDLRYVGPDASPFGFALQDISNLVSEMYRVVHHMAQSVDNSAAAMARSADSKQVDAAMTAIVLKALAQEVSRHALDVCELVGLVRGDKEVDWQVKGMDEFGQTPIDSLLKQAQIVDAISIPSATFQRQFKAKLAKSLMGEDADDEDREAVDDELEEAIPQEMFSAGPKGLAALAQQGDQGGGWGESPAEESTGEEAASGKPVPRLPKLKLKAGGGEEPPKAKGKKSRKGTKQAEE